MTAEKVTSRIAPTIRDCRALPETAKAAKNIFLTLEQFVFECDVIKCTEKCFRQIFKKCSANRGYFLLYVEGVFSEHLPPR
jgi:hypothetical protein